MWNYELHINWEGKTELSTQCRRNNIIVKLDRNIFLASKFKRSYIVSNKEVAYNQ
jgi:hypothetical protein